MIEKKFRIWDVELRKFYYWNISQACPTCLTKEYIKKNTKQYTGFNDKNKTEIYEEDTVEYEGTNYKVKFKDGGFDLYRKNNFELYLCDCNKYVEVTGE